MVAHAADRYVDYSWTRRVLAIDPAATRWAEMLVLILPLREALVLGSGCEGPGGAHRPAIQVAPVKLSAGRTAESSLNHSEHEVVIAPFTPGTTVEWQCDQVSKR